MVLTALSVLSSVIGLWSGDWRVAFVKIEYVMICTAWDKFNEPNSVLEGIVPPPPLTVQRIITI